MDTGLQIPLESVLGFGDFRACVRGLPGKIREPVAPSRDISVWDEIKLGSMVWEGNEMRFVSSMSIYFKKILKQTGDVA
jgi:hypothetical protein